MLFYFYFFVFTVHRCLSGQICCQHLKQRHSIFNASFKPNTFLESLTAPLISELYFKHYEYFTSLGLRLKLTLTTADRAAEVNEDKKLFLTLFFIILILWLFLWQSVWLTSGLIQHHICLQHWFNCPPPLVHVYMFPCFVKTLLYLLYLHLLFSCYLHYFKCNKSLVFVQCPNYTFCDQKRTDLSFALFWRWKLQFIVFGNL